MPRKLDLTGQKFNNLFVDSLNHVKTEANLRREKYYNVICDCGNRTVVRSGNLRSNQTKSCGCLKKERTYEANYKGYGVAVKNTLYKNYIGNANKRSLEFNLTFEQFVELIEQLEAVLNMVRGTLGLTEEE